MGDDLKVIPSRYGADLGFEGASGMASPSEKSPVTVSVCRIASADAMLH